ncbi:MAG: hypothetical protein LUE21_03800 [Oscillospiraceae bacterium]|nr:hypothetical protein [Oscillospiraceae bacterium]
MKASTKRLARLALITALGVVFLVLASVLPTGRLALLAVASFAVCVARMLYGFGWGIGVFAVTAGLGFLLYPGAAVISYAAFFGYYPLVKSLLERFHSRVAEWALKLGLYTIVFALYWTLLSVGGTFPWYALYLLGAVAFAVYDWCLSMMVRIYIEKIARYVK